MSFVGDERLRRKDVFSRIYDELTMKRCIVNKLLEG